MSHQIVNPRPLPDGWHWLAGLPGSELLDIPLSEPDQAGNETHAASFGCDQDWYGEHWQRQAGCGPCTSATLLLYLARSRPELASLYPLPSFSRSQFVFFMEQIWHFVTPGRMGVNEASTLIDGVTRFAAARQILLQGFVFTIPGATGSRQPLEAFRNFISAGLQTGCPVAFLNLSNGRLTNLDSWHWVTVTALFSNEQGQYLAEIADSGEKKQINLSLWYLTTRLGGAAVYFTHGLPIPQSAEPDVSQDSQE